MKRPRAIRRHVPGTLVLGLLAQGRNDVSDVGPDPGGSPTDPFSGLRAAPVRHDAGSRRGDEVPAGRSFTVAGRRAHDDVERPRAVMALHMCTGGWRARARMAQQVVAEKGTAAARHGSGGSGATGLTTLKEAAGGQGGRRTAGLGRGRGLSNEANRPAGGWRCRKEVDRGDRMWAAMGATPSHGVRYSLWGRAPDFVQRLRRATGEGKAPTSEWRGLHRSARE